MRKRVVQADAGATRRSARARMASSCLACVGMALSALVAFSGFVLGQDSAGYTMRVTDDRGVPVHSAQVLVTMSK